MRRLPEYRWPVGMEQTPANRRFRLPPRHWNPEPKFGLRVPRTRLPHVDDGDYISVSYLSEIFSRSALATAYRFMQPLRDDDYIIFANESLETRKPTPQQLRQTSWIFKRSAFLAGSEPYVMFYRAGYFILAARDLTDEEQRDVFARYIERQRAAGAPYPGEVAAAEMPLLQGCLVVPEISNLETE